MKFSRPALLPLALAGLALTPLAAQAPEGARAWSMEEARPILEKTQTIRLAPDLSGLAQGERQALAKLVQVGQIFQDLYEGQRHRMAVPIRHQLERGVAGRAPRAEAEARLTLYRLFQGPIAVTLDNRRVPFVAVDDAPPGKNVYPWDLTRPEWTAYLAAHPDQRDALTHPLSVVRRAEAATLRIDLAALRRHPVLDTLHPGLRARLEGLAAAPDRTRLYGLPYSVAYADDMVRAFGLLNEAADLMAPTDAEFAGYLRNRARDLLSDDYESGDAAWVTGHFGHLNAQIGAYETYDDELAGTRAFHAVSLLANRTEETTALRRGMQGLQAVENALPYERHKRIREDIPVGAYDVIADFGQARGGNTASILPNDALYARRYGRTILLRANIMRSPEIFAGTHAAWAAAVAPAFAGDLTADSTFQRTLWHEVGHYLGVDRTRDNRDLDAALGADGNLIEEMKADLVSLFAGEELRRRGYYTDAQLRSLYAAGINRTLQNVRPRREQPYQTMQLMQFNWFLAHGVLSVDRASGRLSIDYRNYHRAVADMLREVLAIQDRGDPAAADAFVTRWSQWDEGLHGRVASAMRAQQRYRYRLFTYAALGQ